MAVGVTKKVQDPDEMTSVRPPPDGGWGWVVVFASFMIHIIADGVTYTFGIFFVEFQRYYDEGKGATSWIVSILVGMTLGCGPIASALTNKYGCRAITILGSVIATLGFIVSLFAPNVTTLYVTIGLCVGFGFGLIYLPAIVIVTCYFEKRRAFATGIAVCGSGLGTFIFAPLTEVLVESYGWKGAMLIIAGLVLNCAVFGALMRPPEVENVKIHKKLTRVEVVSKSREEKSRQKLRRSVTAHGQLAEIDDDNNQINPPRASVYLLPDAACEQPSKKCWSVQNLTEHSPVKEEGSSKSLIWNERMMESISRPLNRKDVFYGGSILNLPQYRSNPSMYTASVTHIPPMKVLSSDSKTRRNCFEAYDALSEMMNFSILADPIFLLFTVSNFCTSIGFNVPYVYIKDRALLLGLSSEESSYLIAIIGIFNTVSRVLLGYISDKPWLNRLWLYNGALSLCGIATILSVLCSDYLSQSYYAAVFGATAGAFVGLTSVILVDLLGLEKLTNAFGLLLLFQGIAASIGPPIAGWLFDLMKSYDPGFFVAGAAITVSGLLLFAIPWLQNKSVDDAVVQETTTSINKTDDCDSVDDDDDEELKSGRALEILVTHG